MHQWRAAEDIAFATISFCWHGCVEVGASCRYNIVRLDHHVSGLQPAPELSAGGLDFLCPQCGLVLKRPLRERDALDLERHSDCTQSTHSSDTGDSVQSLFGTGRVFFTDPVGYFTHGYRIMHNLSLHPNMLTAIISLWDSAGRKRWVGEGAGSKISLSWSIRIREDHLTTGRIA